MEVSETKQAKRYGGQNHDSQGGGISESRNKTDD